MFETFLCPSLLWVLREYYVSMCSAQCEVVPYQTYNAIIKNLSHLKTRTLLLHLHIHLLYPDARNFLTHCTVHTVYAAQKQIFTNEFKNSFVNIHFCVSYTKNNTIFSNGKITKTKIYRNRKEAKKRHR